MIEKIKEKKRSEFIRESTQKEQKEIDEIVSAKGNRFADMGKVGTEDE